MQINKYKIADFIMEIQGDPVYMVDRFADFTCGNDEKTDITVRFIENKKHFPKYIWDKGTRIGIFHVYEDDDVIYQYFPYQKHKGIKLIEIRNNFHDFTYYLCDKKDSLYAKNMGMDKYIEHMQGVIFNLIQESFFNMILFEDSMSIHSASVIYNDKAILFSASSGTGKSTQANKWNRLLGCDILDGDVTVCRKIGDKFYVYGLPWCGSSGQYQNRRVELLTIIFLKQGPENIVNEISIKDKISYVFSSTFSETWNEQMANNRAKITEKIIGGVKLFEYSCNLDDESVNVLKQWLLTH